MTDLRKKTTSLNNSNAPERLFSSQTATTRQQTSGHTYLDLKPNTEPSQIVASISVIAVQSRESVCREYSTIMRVLGLLISSSLSRGTISWDGSSWRLLQMCGQLLCTTERKAWSRTMLAVQPIAASWSLQNNFYVDAMFEKQWLLVPGASLHGSCSQLALQSLPWAVIIWSRPDSLDAEMGKIWSTETEHTHQHQRVSSRKGFSVHFKSVFSVLYSDCLGFLFQSFG